MIMGNCCHPCKIKQDDRTSTKRKRVKTRYVFFAGKHDRCAPLAAKVLNVTPRQQGSSITGKNTSNGFHSLALRASIGSIDCDSDELAGASRSFSKLFQWLLPGAIFMLVPKCPACLAAHVMLWTGLGLSFSAAWYLRWGMLLMGGAALMFLIAERRKSIRNFFRYFMQEKKPCPTK